MYDIYEVTLSANGRSLVSQRRLNIRGISGYRANQFRGFGDIIIRAQHRKRASLRVYGYMVVVIRYCHQYFYAYQYRNCRYHAAGADHTGRFYAGFNATSLLQELDPLTGNLVGSSVALSYGPADFTEPYNARTGTCGISLTKGVSNPTPYIGSTVTFTVTVTNNGPDKAHKITVQDVIPAGFTYVAGSIAGGTAVVTPERPR